jgi:hypothetical protein
MTDERHDDETMIEDYLDCTGKKRTFRLQSYAGGMFLDATEVLDGEPIGIRLVMKMDLHGHLPWGEMRERIRSRLAERDLAVDPDTRRLAILRGLVRAHIHRAHDVDEDGPIHLRPRRSARPLRPRLHRAT